MKNNFKLIISLTLLLLLSFSNSISADGGEIAALGHDFTTLEGTTALSTNPAFLNKSDDKIIFEIDMLSSFWNNGINLNHLNQYLDDSEKNKILNKLGSNGLVTSVNLEPNINFIYGPAALSLGVNADGQGAISTDVIDLLLNGNEIGETYTVKGTDFSGAIYGDAGISFSYPIEKASKKMNIKSFTLGGSLHYLYGGMINFDTTGDIELDYGYEEAFTDGSAKLNYAEKSSGFSFDIGGKFEIDDKLTVGASLMNIGSLKAEEGRSIDISSLEELEEIFNSDNIPEGEKIDNLSYKLPRKIKVGAKYDLLEKVDIYGDYSLISYDIGRNESIIAVGGEYAPLKFIPLRAGVNYSTLRKDIVLSGGMGIHLGPVQMNLGISDLKAFTINAKGLEAGISLKLAF